MRLNNKGFAISGILYSLLILFLILLMAVLGVLGSAKYAFDKIKEDVIKDLSGVTNPYIYVDCEKYLVRQSFSFNVLTGIKVIDENNNIVSATISANPATISTSSITTYTINYSATYSGKALQATRTIEVKAGLTEDYICE